ncbi:MAG: site-specific integrase [Dorea sp.]|nr:site-specific integrase [Dorea sp.]
MPRKGENIYKRKDGRWEGRYIKGRDGKKAIYGYVYSKSYSDVKKKLALKRTEYAHTDFKKEITDGKDGTFSELSDMWIESIQSSVKESTWIKYRNTLQCNIIPLIGEKRLKDLDFSAVSRMCNDLLEFGGKKKTGLASKTVADSLAVTKTVIRYASQLKYKIDQTAFSVSVGVKVKPLRVLNIEEQQALISHVLTDLNLTGLGILICLFTGIRIGELCALTWDDISIESNVISINKTMQRLQMRNCDKKTTIIISEPKSQCSIREIPITTILAELLNKQPIKEGYILTGRKNKYVEPRIMQNRIKTVMKDCEIKDAHFHTLRHTFATRCIEVGFDVKSLSEILGHSSVNITLNRYVHPSMQLKRQNIEKLSELFTVK